MIRLVLPLLLCWALFTSIYGYASAVGKITVDPNTGGPAALKGVTDTRLSQKITYEASYVPVQQILEDLSTMTGIKLYAGSSKSDWPVRSRKMNIFVKDIKMADLMNSIAHVMKFKWSCNNDLTPPTYRLIVDGKAVAAVDAQKAQADSKKEAQLRKMRERWLETIMRDGAKTDSQVNAMRGTDPAFYRIAKTGGARALHALFEEAPEAKERFLAGRSFRISTGKLSQNTTDLLLTGADGMQRFLQRGSGETPVGLGDTFKPGDNLDVACRRLDADNFTPNECWGIHSMSSVGYLHIARGERDIWEIANLKDKDAECMKAYFNRENDILDGLQTFGSSISLLDNSIAPLMQANARKDEESLYPSEPLNVHSDFDELEKTIKLIIDTPHTDQNPELVIAKYIALVQKALADATGLGVVSDSWANIKGDRRMPVREGKLSELLDKFTEKYNYNWGKSSTILEFRHRKWWKNRLNQFSDDRITAWSVNTRKNGVLSLDDLAQISNLTYDQAVESLKPDKVLGTAGIYGHILGIFDSNCNVRWLRLYSTLSPQLRALLMTQNGINGHMLTSAQWKLAQAMFDRIGASRGDAIFILEQEPNGKEAIYQFKEIDNETGEEDRRWRVYLPKYDPPKK